MNRVCAILGALSASALFAAACWAQTGSPVLSSVDWSTVQSATGAADVRFHMRWTNNGTSQTAPFTGNMAAQPFGVFMADDGQIGGFDVPAIQANSFFDVFLEVPLATLPPSAPKTQPGTSTQPNSPCDSTNHWDGNVDVTWNTPAGGAQSTWHLGQVRVCPGAGSSFVHVVTGCAGTTGMPWAIFGLCPGFTATLVEEDKVTPSPNPLPPGWHGYLVTSASAAVPVGSVCCFKVQFTCAGATSDLQVCATACDCSPQNPTLGSVDWTAQPGASGTMVQFHLRFENNNAAGSTSPVSGSVMSQVFGVYEPDFGPAGTFNVPAIQANGFFDVFTEVPLTALPPSASVEWPGGTGGSGGGPNPNLPCPPDTNWIGNVDVRWNGPAGAGQGFWHNAQLLVCPGGGNSFIHVTTNCMSALGATWTIAGLCPGFSATLVENDHVTPAPAVLPFGWSGFIRVSATAVTPPGVTCCFKILFDCAGDPARIEVCATTCNCDPANPTLGSVDWSTVPGAAGGSSVRFHLHWENNTPSPSMPVSGNLMPQLFGVFEPDMAPAAAFDVPAIGPNGFFDVFTEVPLTELPPSAQTILPGGGPNRNSPCPPDTSWINNVDVTWNGAAGAGQSSWHAGSILVWPGAGSSYIHVVTNCTTAAGLTWSLTGLCPGFTATLVENDRVTPAPALLPPGWSGFIQVTAAAPVPPGTTCCFLLLFDCGGLPARIKVCATTCYWGATTVGPSTLDLGFGIRAAMPNPSNGTMTLRYAIPHEGNALLEVFDAGGQRVRTLAHGEQTAGPHLAIWNARGDNGLRLPSGTYFVRLRFGDRSDSRKVMLVQ